MTSKLESAYSKALSSTFKVVSPIKRTIKKTECEVHLYIQENALEILNINGYKDEFNKALVTTPVISLDLKNLNVNVLNIHIVLAYINDPNTISIVYNKIFLILKLNIINAM